MNRKNLTMYLYFVDDSMLNVLYEIRDELNAGQCDGVYHDVLDAFMQMWIEANDTDNFEHQQFVHRTLRDVGYYKLANDSSGVTIIDQYIDDLPYYSEMGLVNWLCLKTEASTIARA
jgi:hypothetical protein